MTNYRDPLTGELVEDYFDHSTGLLHIRRTTDVEPLLDDLTQERENGGQGWSPGRTWRKMGSIPCVEVDRILREEGINMMDPTPEAKARVRRYFSDNPKLTMKW